MQQQYRRRVVACVAVVLSAAGLAACDNALQPAVPAIRAAEYTGELPRVVDGRLVFQDEKQLTAYLEPIANAQTAEIVAAEQKLPGFQSLRSYLDSGEWTEEGAKAGDTEELPGSAAKAAEADGVGRSDFPLGDPVLSAINSRGEVQIADRVFKLTRDNVYEVSPADLPVLDEQVPTLSSPAPAQPDDRIGVHPVVTTPQDADAPAANRLAGPRRNVTYVTSGSNRLRCSSYITNIFFYAEAGVNTAWQRKHSFWFVTWWTDQWQSGTLKHNFTASLNGGSYSVPPAPMGPSSGSQSLTGTSQVHNTLAWIVGWGVYIKGKVNAQHGVNNSSMNATCTTSASA